MEDRIISSAIHVDGDVHLSAILAVHLHVRLVHVLNLAHALNLVRNIVRQLVLFVQVHVLRPLDASQDAQYTHRFVHLSVRQDARLVVRNLCLE
ncbi:MAG: hypothetical protein JJU12_01225 [Chlamydiales bacterium]|nr:hypothetical protein [Chlamydiales bacterium]